MSRAEKPHNVLAHNALLRRLKGQPFDLFHELTPQERAQIAPLFRVMVYPGNTIIFTQGFPARYLYLLRQGEVHIRYKPHDGPALTVATIAPGGVFGWSAALMRPTYSSSAITAGKTEVLRLHNQELVRFYQQNPKVGLRLVDILAAAIARRLNSPRQQIVALLEEGLRHPLPSE